MVAWHTLFFKIEEENAVNAPAAIAEALLNALTANGYTRYDPFPGGNGTPPALKTFVRQFVSPAREGWVRVLGKSDPEALITFKSQWSILYSWFDQAENETAGWRVLENGDWRAEAEAFTPFLKPNATVDMIDRARSGEILPMPEPKSSAGGSPLPADVQQLAADRGLDPKKADRMIERVTGQIFGRLDRRTGGEANAMRHQAQALVHGDSANWDSVPGRRLRAVAALLTLPDDWRLPPWEDVREAYHVARLLSRNPKAKLLPGEHESLAVVPDAIQYVPVYVGKP